MVNSCVEILSADKGQVLRSSLFVSFFLF